MFVMKMSKSVKYDSALEDVENISKIDIFRDVYNFHRIEEIQKSAER